MLCDINNKMDRDKHHHLSAGILHSSLQHFHVSSNDDNDDDDDDDDDDDVRTSSSHPSWTS